MAVVRYWKDIDVLDIVLKKGKYTYSQPVAEDVVLDVSQSGEILSVEIHHATKRLAKPLAQQLSHRYLVAR
mgnify:FL=1